VRGHTSDGDGGKELGFLSDYGGVRCLYGGREEFSFTLPEGEKVFISKFR